MGGWGTPGRREEKRRVRRLLGPGDDAAPTVHLKSRRDPSPDRRRIREITSNHKAHAAHALGLSDAILIRHVVADEHGNAAGERRGRHERGDGAAFVHANGADFPGHLGGQQHKILWTFGQEEFQRQVEGFGHVRHGTVMQHEPVALALDRGAGMAGGERLGGVDPGLRRRGEIGRDEGQAGAVSQDGTVLAGDGEGSVAQQGIHLGDRAASDDGQGVGASAAEGAQIIGEAGRDDHAVRGGGDVDEGAVHVEQEGGLVRRGRGFHAARNPGGSAGFPVEVKAGGTVPWAGRRIRRLSPPEPPDPPS